MKKSILLSLLLALATASYAYVPMLGTGRSWTYFNYIHDTNSFQYYTANYSILSDTVINDLTYFKSEFTKGLLREDVDNEKVYLLDTDGIEYLLYDFSLSVGDSAEIYFRDTRPVDSLLYSRIYITSIDTMIDSAGTVLRVFNYLTYDCTLTYAEPGYYIERYGAHHGLVDYISRIGYSGGSSTELRCAYDEAGNLTYFNHKAGDEYLGNDCNGSGKGDYEAVENVNTDNLILSYDANTLIINAEDIISVEIFTATGAKIGSYSTSTISLSLTPGIYFARITANGIISTERFVVR